MFVISMSKEVSFFFFGPKVILAPSQLTFFMVPFFLNAFSLNFFLWSQTFFFWVQKIHKTVTWTTKNIYKVFCTTKKRFKLSKDTMGTIFLVFLSNPFKYFSVFGHKFRCYKEDGFVHYLQLVHFVHCLLFCVYWDMDSQKSFK